MRNRLAGFALALGVFGIDRAIKALMAGPLQLQAVGVIKLLPFFDLRWTENRGVSYGMFTADSSEMKFALLGMTGAIALGVAVWMLREKVLGEILALALVLGGALGNIYDRAVRGYVIDYADLHIGEWRPFLIFNLADAAITFGVLILLARSLLSREKPAQPADADHDTATETV
ncbi:signal peptidase II [Novosphingobium sp. AAP93]|uniref:signal peptidase II n=1 Tax=Novosphingobium sp. AAP93 TaxID=1523427 RepID=UPI0006BA0755|nr:signal peptidase II [Novosphingobium sp. AAP93]KPF81229.1 signal peptidase II [Novosphingobium sp. AAP93]